MTETSSYRPADRRNPHPGRRTVRRVAGYGGALAMTPYLLIKVSWVVGALIGVLPVDAGFTRTGWVVLNTVTIVMAATGIAVALVLAGVAGRRVPDPVLLILAWIGVGFLVPMLPYLLASTVLGGEGNAGDGGASLPAWEGVLIQVSFAGLALGLAVALPLAVLERWPALLTGRLGDDEPTGPRSAFALPAVIAAVLVGALGLYWALGGPLGLADPSARDLNWRLLHGNAAGWALLGAVSAWLLDRRRPGGLPRWIPTTIAAATSGFLVAWNCWKLPFALYLAVHDAPLDQPWPEQLGPAAAHCVLGALAGAAMLATLLHSRPQHRSCTAGPGNGQSSGTGSLVVQHVRDRDPGRRPGR